MPDLHAGKLDDQPIPDVDLLAVVLDQLVDGHERTAELTARMAWQMGTPLAELYESLRRGMHRYSRRSADVQPLSHYQLDERVIRLAARLSTNSAENQEFRALVVSTENRSVPAAIVHLFAEQGVSAQTVPLVALQTHYDGLHGVPLELAVRYIVVDFATLRGVALSESLDQARSLGLLQHPECSFLGLTENDDTDIAGRLSAAMHVHQYSLVTTLPSFVEAIGGHLRNPLTPRERDVLAQVADGATNAQAARALGISMGTVKTYLERAQEKTHARDRASTVAVAVRMGWL